MSGNLIDLRRRIKSIRNTQKITRAMKTVSAAKLRKSVTERKRNVPLLEKYIHILKQVTLHQSDIDIPLLQEKDSGGTVIVAIGSNKGLCGSFNSYIIREVEKYFSELKDSGKEPSLITIGTKIHRYFSKREYPILKSYNTLMKEVTYSEVTRLSSELQSLFMEDTVQSIQFVTTRFISSSRQKVERSQLFPIQPFWEERAEDQPEIEYIYEPSQKEIFDFVLPKYIHLFIYRVLLESAASEHAARMIAMELATQNADDMIRQLTLTMNKLRQASITKELLEIITATEALNQ